MDLSPSSDNQTKLIYQERIMKVRESMLAKNLEAYIIPHSDPHQSEYLSDYWDIIKWISGFDGSAATIILTKDYAGLWTDSRYFLQADQQLKGTGIELCKMTSPNRLGYFQWLTQHLSPHSTIGVDGKLISIKWKTLLESKLKPASIYLDIHQELISEFWQERELPDSQIYLHEKKFAGKGRDEKLEAIRKNMRDNSVDTLLLSSLDDIAWTFNLRGNDIPFNPVFYSYAIITHTNTTLFVHPQKLTPDVHQALKDDQIEIQNYDEWENALESLAENTCLWISPVNFNAVNYKLISDNIDVKKSHTPPTLLKAQKEEREIAHIKQTMVQDGIAMVKFIKWLTGEIKHRDITEIEASTYLSQLRSSHPAYKGESFSAISGYKGNGAIVHYRAVPESAATMTAEGVYLIDSGGHYLGGTTDITRTIALGKVSERAKRDFTLVLKGHIQLATAIFPEGTKGYQLDVLARAPMWKEGITYGHGTGHGVGYFLNVHEGPQNISPSGNPVAADLSEGMIISNEPGIYRPNEYGIRIENLVLVRPYLNGEYGPFYYFETLSLCPIDMSMIQVDLLSQEEKIWLNEYHKTVYSQLSQHLSENECQWLAVNTQTI